MTKTGDSGFTTWGKWGSDTNTYTRTIDMKLAKDIFDIDCCILYGRNVFPIKAENWQTYEGWTSDNMTMVVNKYLGDWQELYGFDIPENIGMCKIPEKDIDAIIEALKSKYGDKFTESRQEAVRFALSWVGRGQYNNKHHSHGFLTHILVKYIKALLQKVNQEHLNLTVQQQTVQDLVHFTLTILTS